MSNDSLLHRFGRSLGQAGRFLLALVRNRYFFAGLGLFVVLAGVSYVVLDAWLMPLIARHGVSLTVPDVRSLSYPEAHRQLAALDLAVEPDSQRFNPNLPRDVVVDQTPPPYAQVKPGRRIYLTVNSGVTPRVTVPDLLDISLREAQNRLTSVGLRFEEPIPDSIPSPYRNTVTRQLPAPGSQLPAGAGVSLWYSTGYGDAYVNVPDIAGLTVRQARQLLLSRKLRSVLIGAGADEEVLALIVDRQSPEAGTRLREGSEIRIFPAADSLLAPTDSLPAPTDSLPPSQ